MRSLFAFLCVFLTCALHASMGNIERWKRFCLGPAHECPEQVGLARDFAEDGFRNLAFYLLESARHVYGDELFDATYATNAVPVSNFRAYSTLPKNARSEADIERHIRAAAKDDPLLTQYLRLIDTYTPALETAKRDKAKAKATFIALLDEAEKTPELLRQLAVCQWLALPTLRIVNDPDRAKPLFLTIYFSDPHAYCGEFVEFRIRDIDVRRRESGILNQALAGLDEAAKVRKIRDLAWRDPGLFLSRNAPAFLLATDLPPFPQAAWVAFLEHPHMAFRNTALKTLLKMPDWTPETLTAIRSLATSPNPILRQQYYLLATRFLTDDEILARLHKDFPAITADSLKAVRTLHPKATP